MVNTAEGICSHDFVSWECVISVFRTKDENQTRRQIEGPTVNLFFNRMTGPYLGRKERPGDTTAWLPYHSLFSIPSVCTLQEFIKKKKTKEPLMFHQKGNLFTRYLRHECIWLIGRHAASIRRDALQFEWWALSTVGKWMVRRIRSPLQDGTEYGVNAETLRSACSFRYLRNCAGSSIS